MIVFVRWILRPTFVRLLLDFNFRDGLGAVFLFFGENQTGSLATLTKLDSSVLQKINLILNCFQFEVEVNR